MSEMQKKGMSGAGADTAAPIYDLTRAAVEQACIAAGQPAYRARQIWDWLYRRRAATWEAMTNLPAALRQALAARFLLPGLTLLQTQGAAHASATRKLLLALPDGERIETVLIPMKGALTVCVSSQVGCKYRCAFCASGMGGFQRDLTPGEMVGQVLASARVQGAAPARVVFMGIGEPLDNYDAVLAAIRILNDPDGLRIGARRITLSTSGVIPGIQRLAEEGLQVELSVSLHAPDDALRSRLMPINRRYPLADLLAVCRRYADQTGRLITFEYTLIGGVNDTLAQARALARLLRPLAARVNLIPLSAVPEFQGTPSTEADTTRFMAALEAAHIHVTLRASKGGEIKAACGQLRRRPKDE